MLRARCLGLVLAKTDTDTTKSPSYQSLEMAQQGAEGYPFGGRVDTSPTE